MPPRNYTSLIAMLFVTQIAVSILDAEAEARIRLPKSP